MARGMNAGGGSVTEVLNYQPGQMTLVVVTLTFLLLVLLDNTGLLKGAIDIATGKASVGTGGATTSAPVPSVGGSATTPNPSIGTGRAPILNLHIPSLGPLPSWAGK